MLRLYVKDKVLELLHLSGHTPYQIAVYMPEEKVIFTGDNVVFKTRPFYHECRPLLWLETLDALKKMDFGILIPGHGEICDKRAVDEMISYNHDIFGQVRKAIEEGLSPEETVERVIFDDRMPLVESQKEFGLILDQMGILRIYEELKSFHTE